MENFFFFYKSQFIAHRILERDNLDQHDFAPKKAERLKNFERFKNVSSLFLCFLQDKNIIYLI